MFKKILVANRGEIACRVFRSAKALGIPTVAIHSEADSTSLHARQADESICIGPPPASQSYIDIDKVLSAVRSTGADAVHPGYGFLSENAKFAQALQAENVAFIGPPFKAIKAMGDKIASKKIAVEAGVSTVPGYLGEIGSAAEAIEIAGDIGFPVMIKASAGGGGKGMRIARSKEDVAECFEAARREAANSFGDDRIFVEKFIVDPRHIEIQILADQHGNCIYLNERECSIQRRHQKVIEEAPSPFLDSGTRSSMGRQAVALAEAVGYHSAGTVEFIVDRERNFYFLEMNTRLQVEHPITELITGIDLVEQMIRIAAGEKLSIAQDEVSISGWAMESRICAEDPRRSFLPSTGRLERYRPPPEHASDTSAVRVDTGVFEGGEISVYYDSMIAKLCTWAAGRDEAIEEMRNALDGFLIEGVKSNIPFLSTVMDHPRFNSGEFTTAFIEEEFPSGFAGAQLDSNKLRLLAACAGAMHRFCEVRRTRSSGRMSNHGRRVGDAWVVRLSGLNFRILVKADRIGAIVEFDDGGECRVASDWRPGQHMAVLKVNERILRVKVAFIVGGFRFSYRGAELDVQVRTPRQSELGARMADQRPQSEVKDLLCPMPGTIVSLDVSVGDAVVEGQILCKIEAMKMENALTSERNGIIKTIHVEAGATVGVDDTILSFE